MLGHLLKTETVLKVARLHFHQQIQICVFYRAQFLFPILPSNRGKPNNVCTNPSDPFFSQIRITPGRSGVDPHPTCSASSFRCPHILMQSLAFRPGAPEYSIIQTCHSASHLILKHYHTNTAKRTKGSQLLLGINLSNSQSKPLAPQACRGFQ